MILFITLVGSFTVVSEFKVCFCGLTPAGNQAPHTCSLTPPTVGWDRQSKVSKLLGWDKDGLIGQARTVHSIKAKQGIHSQLLMGNHLHHRTVTW